MPPIKSAPVSFSGSPWQRHVESWKSCQRCSLCQTRANVVLARGAVPCDLLLCGEAPGKSEDALGQCFVGPAGRLLDQIVLDALVPWQVDGTEGFSCNSIRVGRTNLVACVPVDEEGKKDGPPSDESIKACLPRLKEFVQLCRPRLICCVGRLATDWINSKRRGGLVLDQPVPPMVDIDHPAAVLRANWAQQGLMRQRCVVVLRRACEEHLS